MSRWILRLELSLEGAWKEHLVRGTGKESSFIMDDWLVVSTPLKNISQLEV
jgi:hypothetical protein